MSRERRLNNFTEVKEAWGLVWPEWLESYKSTGLMVYDPSFYNFKFTPIEDYMWQDIRVNGMPFYPQFPVCGYFLDFACPFLKIAIECDGKDWHNPEKDLQRELDLAADGWTIFRVTGAECYKFMDSPWEVEEENNIYDWFFKTATGVLYAINQIYFIKKHTNFAKDNIEFCYQTLKIHQPQNAAYKEIPLVEFGT